MNDGSWGWRALRLLAKKSPHFFTHGNNPIAKLPDYLTQMLGKMGGSQTNGTPTTTANKDKDNANPTAPNLLNKLADDVDPSSKSATNSGKDEDDTNSGAVLCTEAMLEKLAAKVGKNWKKMAPKLGVAEEAVAKIAEEDTEDKGMEEIYEKGRQGIC